MFPLLYCQFDISYMYERLSLSVSLIICPSLSLFLCLNKIKIQKCNRVSKLVRSRPVGIEFTFFWLTTYNYHFKLINSFLSLTLFVSLLAYMISNFMWLGRENIFLIIFTFLVRKKNRNTGEENVKIPEVELEMNLFPM